MKRRCKHVVKMQAHIKHVHDGEQRPSRPRKKQKRRASSEESDGENDGVPEEDDPDLATASEVKSGGEEVSSRGNLKVTEERDKSSGSEFATASSQGGRRRKTKVIFDL